MTDDLKYKFEQLLADPPPPTGVPSQAVAARVRTVRRRRTAGVVTLAAAAVVAIAVAAGNLTDIDSAPPVTNTPNAPTTIVTGPPTASPTTTPPAPPVVSHTVGPTGSTKTGGTTGTTTGATTGHTQGTTKTPPARPPLSAHVKLNPVISGRTVTMRVTVSGTVLVPTVEGKDLPADTSFLNLSGGTQYFWGDGEQGGSDGGSMSCDGAKTRKTGQETYTAETHTYAKPGTYTFHYTVRYCSLEDTVKTVKVTVK
ncbi:hypothetical protein E0H73_21650 [Kribbella pittospori]|uniref:PKD domain-containing protein n=1 Tax=Kribbella pittospori TaxID=722689 RepID=A0A4R0KNP6_9ACTN|nr:hypothetical protein [Kribbella pittospori]TCC60536.1 hypothetical protein E0H73_21650 [Kribbella pittospori]